MTWQIALTIWAAVGPLAGVGVGAALNHVLAGRRDSAARRRAMQGERARCMRIGLEALQAAADKHRYEPTDLIALRAALYIFGDDVARTAAGLFTTQRPENWHRRLDSLLVAIRERTEADERALGLEPIEIWTSYQKHLEVRRDMGARNAAELARFQETEAAKLAAPAPETPDEKLEPVPADTDDDTEGK